MEIFEMPPESGPFLLVSFHRYRLVDTAIFGEYGRCTTRYRTETPSCQPEEGAASVEQVTVELLHGYGCTRPSTDAFTPQTCYQSGPTPVEHCDGCRGEPDGCHGEFAEVTACPSGEFSDDELRAVYDSL